MNPEKYLLNISSKKIKLGLLRTKELLKIVGSPQKDIFSIQLIGTNGKGSTASFLANVLKQKHKVGLYTSPHLIDYKERISINSKKINTRTVSRFINLYQKKIDIIKPSFFETMTALALWYFKEKKVEIAILETGLGGRLDSVTACQNNILGFTNISFDHESVLGKTLEQIAKEKAQAIIHCKQEIFSVKQPTTVKKALYKEVKRKKTKEIIFTEPINYTLEFLKGEHQKNNAGLAHNMLKGLIRLKYKKIKNTDIRLHIANTKWAGRFEIIQTRPTIIFDVAHNQAGIDSFLITFKEFIKKTKHKKLFLICGFEKNKTIKHKLNILNKYFDFIYCTETKIRKSMSSKLLQKQFDDKKSCENDNIKDVLKQITTKAHVLDVICIIGSHFFAPHIKKHLK